MLYYDHNRTYFVQKKTYKIIAAVLALVALICIVLSQNYSFLMAVGVALAIGAAVLFWLSTDRRVKDEDIDKMSAQYETTLGQYTPDEEALAKRLLRNTQPIFLHGFSFSGREGLLVRRSGDRIRSSYCESAKFYFLTDAVLVDRQRYSLIDEYNEIDRLEFLYTDLKAATLEQDQISVTYNGSAHTHYILRFRLHDKQNAVVLDLPAYDDAVTEELINRINRNIKDANPAPSARRNLDD